MITPHLLVQGDQLNHIFQLLGTPSAADWPPNSNILREAFPVRPPRPLHAIIPEMDQQALDLLKVTSAFTVYADLDPALFG